MGNQWSKIASETKKIQDAKNRALNGKVLSLVKEYLDVKKKKNAFDYGCGWGEFANILQEIGFKVTAFDDADSMVERARENYKKPRFLLKEEFYKELPKLKNKFDLIASNLVLCILKKKIKMYYLIM